MKKEQNASLYIQKVEGSTGTYYNYWLEVELENGQVAKFQVKQAFFNAKFHSLLVHNLPTIK